MRNEKEFCNQEREKCIGYLFDIFKKSNVFQSNQDEMIAQTLVPVKQVSGYICSEINNIIESDTFISNCSEDWGIITLLIKNNSDKYYKLTFRDRDCFEGYCMCEPTDEGYDVLHKCCGVDCDWCCPIVEVEEICRLQTEEFKGIARDLWKVTDEIMTEHSNMEKEKKEKRDKMLDDIKRYETRIEELVLKLKELE